jgi:hypothetical protein
MQAREHVMSMKKEAFTVHQVAINFCVTRPAAGHSPRVNLAGAPDFPICRFAASAAGVKSDTCGPSGERRVAIYNERMLIFRHKTQMPSDRIIILRSMCPKVCAIRCRQGLAILSAIVK